MKKVVMYVLSVAVAGLICWSCGPKDGAVRIEKINGNKLYVCDFSALKDSLNIPLSELVESIHIVPLDTAREALVGRWASPAVSDNYIGMAVNRQPYKLFDKNGKFLRQIGTVGKGPGEYTLLYCSQIDEPSKSVYLLPWQSDYLLRYGLDGSFISSIPLPTRVPKGNFQVKGNTITVFALPLPGVKNFAWQMDLEGNIKDTIPAGPYVEKKNFYSNEIMSSFNSDQPDVHVFRWEAREDSLYHYDGKKLIPVFAAEYAESKLPLHEYLELPRHFHITLSEMVTAPDGSSTNGNFRFAIVEKETGKAGWGRIQDDLLVEGENIWVGAYNFRNKLYIVNYAAITLKTKLEKMLERDQVSPAVRKRAEEVLKTLQEDDNNVIVWGKLK